MTTVYSSASCAKIAESIEMPFGLWTQVGPRRHGVHIGATWQIGLNGPCAAAMQPALCQITMRPIATETE